MNSVLQVLAASLISSAGVGLWVVQKGNWDQYTVVWQPPVTRSSTAKGRRENNTKNETSQQLAGCCRGFEKLASRLALANLAAHPADNYNLLSHSSPIHTVRVGMCFILACTHLLRMSGEDILTEELG